MTDTQAATAITAISNLTARGILSSEAKFRGVYTRSTEKSVPRSDGGARSLRAANSNSKEKEYLRWNWFLGKTAEHR